jgi:DNA-binding transcriptional MerR regulator
MSARQDSPAQALPPIPAKRYFTIGEVSELCGVKPHVLRYWEQEFSQLRPMKRRGNRRYYQHHEVLLVRRIRQLLYEEGFTINGARNRLGDGASGLARQRGGAAGRSSASEPLVDERQQSGEEHSELSGFDEAAAGIDATGDGLPISDRSGRAVHPASASGDTRVAPIQGDLFERQADSDELLRDQIRAARAHLEAAFRILADN